MYWWKGKLETAHESYALFKAPASRFALIEKEIVAHHSYDVPVIVAWPIIEAHAPYLNWLREETMSGQA